MEKIGVNNMLSYKSLAKQIYDNVGGSKNIENINHCATRLRIRVHNVQNINDIAIKNIEQVAGTVNHGKEYQVVIGTDVANVYNEIIKINGTIDKTDHQSHEKTDNIKNTNFSWSNLGHTIIDFISGTFVPILGVLVAAGLISAVLNIGTSFFGLSTKSGTYTVLFAIYQAGYFFLPLYLGYSAARKLNLNPMMGGFLGAVLVYKTIDSAKGLSFFGLPIPQIQYNTSVIPVLLGIIFMKLVDLVLERVVPKSIKFFVNPLVTMLIVVPITLLWLGPLGFQIGSIIANILKFINLKFGWFSVGIIAAITPFLVMTGTNQALFPICIAAVSTTGYDAFILPGMLAANVAVGASALAVAVYSNDSKEKQLGLSSGLTGLMGITEPALFGILIKNKIAFLSTMAASGLVGILAGFLGLKQYAIVSPGIAALPTFIHANNGQMDMNLWIAILVLCLSALLSFGLTLFFGKKDQRKATNNIYLPVKGKIIPLSNVKDDMFSKGMLGDGFAVIPESEEIYSPVTGEVTMIAKSKHALGLKTKDGTEILLHLGIDTVDLNGEPFKVKVKKGQQVKHGDILVDMNLNMIKAKGKDPIVIVVLTQKNKKVKNKNFSVNNFEQDVGQIPFSE